MKALTMAVGSESCSAGSMACSTAESWAETTAEPTDLRTESMTAANWDARSAAS